MVKDKTSITFTAWLKQQEGRDDPVGDIARDVRYDECWPRARTLRAFRAHLDWEHNASQSALAALERAWNEWQVS